MTVSTCITAIHVWYSVQSSNYFGIPPPSARVWEKIAESMQTVARNTKGLKAKVASWAKGVGLRANFNKQTG